MITGVELDEQGKKRQELVRLVGSVLGFNLLFGLLGAALIYWRSKDPDLVSLPVSTSTAMSEAIREDAAGASLVWWLIAIGVVALATLCWLIWAYASRPATPAEQRKLALPWLILLTLAVVVAFGAGFGVYANAAVAAKWRFLLCISILLGAPLCFLITTAVGVKNSMIPSVPLGRFFRR